MAGLKLPKIKPGKAVEGDALATIFGSAAKAAKNVYNKVKSDAEIIQDRIAKFAPASEAKVERNIRAAAPDILASSEGFSFNPRTGKMLQPGKDVGYMSATKPNPTDESNIIPANSIEDLLNYAKQPEVMSGLRRGDYLGGWSESPGMMTMDPATRFKNKIDAVATGLGAEQRGVFDLGKSNTINLLSDSMKSDVENAALKQQLIGLGQTTSGIGLQAHNQGMNYDEEGKPRSTANNLENLLSIALMARGGRNMFKGAQVEDRLLRPNTGLLSAPGTFAKNTLNNAADSDIIQKLLTSTGNGFGGNKKSMKAATNLEFVSGIATGGILPAFQLARKKLAELGVKEAPYSVPGEPGSTAINIANTLQNKDIADFAVNNINPLDDQGTAFGKLYNFIVDKYANNIYVKPTKQFRDNLLKKVKNKKITINKSVIKKQVEDLIPEENVRLANNKGKPFTYRAAPNLTDEYKAAGKMQLPFHLESIGKMIENGDRGNLTDMLSAIHFNLQKELDTQAVSKYRKLFGGKSLFYYLTYLRNQAMAGKHEISNLDMSISNGIASSANPPVPEQTDSLAALLQPYVEGSLSTKDLNGYLTSNEWFGNTQRYVLKPDGTVLTKINSKGKTVKVTTDEWKAKEKERAKLLASGDLLKNISKGDTTTDIGQLVDALDYVKLHPELRFDVGLINGIKEKITSYIANGGDITSYSGVTHDSWMARSAMGNNKANPVVDKNTIKALNLVFDHISSTNKIEPQTAQEIIWFVTRVINGEGATAPFIPITDTKYIKPWSGYESPTGPVSTTLAQNNIEDLQSKNIAMYNDLIDYIKNNPEAANYLRLDSNDISYNGTALLEKAGLTHSPVNASALEAATETARKAKVAAAEKFDAKTKDLTDYRNILYDRFKRLKDTDQYSKLYDETIYNLEETDRELAAHYNEILPDALLFDDPRLPNFTKLDNLRENIISPTFAKDMLDFTDKDKEVLFNLSNTMDYDSILKFINNTKSTMTPGQYETFVALLPEWTGSLDDLVNAAMTL